MNSEMDQQDKIGTSQYFHYGHERPNPTHKYLWPLLEEATQKNVGEGRRAIDVGCGNGWFSNTLTLNNNEVVGLDINSLELEQAARVFKKEKLAFVYGNLFKINEPFINQFDLIVLNASIQYFSDINELVTKLKTFLKPSGEINIIESPFYYKKESIDDKKRT